MQDFEERHHAFEGCFNFRDIGGYENKEGQKVKWGKYFRAGRQDRMSEADLEGARSLSIKTQIDLRRPDEIEMQGRGPLEAQGTEYVNLPVIPEGGSERLSQLVGDTKISGQRYLGYLHFGPECWQRMFAIFAAPTRLPVLIHCTAGKDRTGVSTAFLLTVLGVDRATIEADYLLTNWDVDRQVDFVENTVGLPEGIDKATMKQLAGVPETAMHDFLNGLDEEYGGALAYLESIGIDQQIQSAVRTEFLE